MTDQNKKLIHKTGSSITIHCPVEKSKKGEIYFEWYKNGNPIESIEERMRITDSGSLKIKNSASEDSGRFLCKGLSLFLNYVAIFEII